MSPEDAPVNSNINRDGTPPPSLATSIGLARAFFLPPPGACVAAIATNGELTQIVTTSGTGGFRAALFA